MSDEIKEPVDNEPISFYGHEVSYWVELHNKAKELGVHDYITEIALLKLKLDEP